MLLSMTTQPPILNGTGSEYTIGKPERRNVGAMEEC